MGIALSHSCARWLRKFRFRLKQAWPLSDPLCRSSSSKRFSDAVNFIHSLPCKITAYQDLDPDHTYVDIFENGDVRRSTRKRWNDENTTASLTELESCKKYMMFDISSVFVRPDVNEKLAFSKLSTLTSVFEKMRFPSPFSSDTCRRGLSLFPWLHCHENMIASDNEIKWKLIRLHLSSEANT